MNRLLSRLGFGLLCATAATAATPLLAQTVPDTVQTIAPALGTPPVAPVQPAPAPVSAAPQPRIDVTEAKAPLQAPVYVPLDQDVYRLIDRYAIKYGADSLGDIHTSSRPYNRAAVGRLGERMFAGMVTSTIGKSDKMDAQSQSAPKLGSADDFNFRYLMLDNWSTLPTYPTFNDRPFLKRFYRNPADFYHVQTLDFTLRVNPVINFQAGTDTDQDGLRFVNTRGIQVEGTIDKRLGFYTYLTDNQMAVPLYVQQRVQRDTIVPHEAYWKYFKNQPDQYDFLTARGYLTYAATKHINVQLGHDRNFIGNGYRSLILSDYAAPYFFLKLNTRIWKFNYQNLFAEMNADRGSQDRVDPKKYFALHHLSLDITPSLNVGVFESVVFSRRRGRFELQYLNPIIFYRAVEQAIGSDDNALLGLDFKWNILRRGQIYGQLMLDEFVLSEIRSGNGWWANKQAFQLGGKYIDVLGLPNLDLQVELNYIRPYTYQHLDRFTNYAHYQQPLAHPMGANLREVLGVLSYQPFPRLTLVGKGFFSEQGLDPADPLTNPTVYTNYGGNVLFPYTNRPREANGNLQEFGFRVGDGLNHQLLHGDLTATWQARHNVWLDAKLIVRNSNLFGNSAIPSVSLRWNTAQRLHEF